MTRFPVAVRLPATVGFGALGTYAWAYFWCGVDFPKAETPRSLLRGALLGCKSLTMTYFHTGTRTIIGAKSFHCPVRDGKEWYQLAMVIRHKG